MQGYWTTLKDIERICGNIKKIYKVDKCLVLDTKCDRGYYEICDPIATIQNSSHIGSCIISEGN